jgi:hypothetical protein
VIQIQLIDELCCPMLACDYGGQRVERDGDVLWGGRPRDGPAERRAVPDL